MESTFRMGSSTIYLSQSETYRNAVAAQYAGTLDLPAFCTALTDGTICEESGLGCDAKAVVTLLQSGAWWASWLTAAVVPLSPC